MKKRPISFGRWGAFVRLALELATPNAVFVT